MIAVKEASEQQERQVAEQPILYEPEAPARKS